MAERRDAPAVDQLREWRIERGLTQRELADMVGVVPQIVSNLETGRNAPDLWTAIRIEDVTGIEPRWWLTVAERHRDEHGPRGNRGART